MRRFSLFILSTAFLFISSLSYGQYSGDSYAQVKSAGKGTIKFAYVETPGFVYRDNTGNLTGICIDIMKDFVEYVNAKGYKLNAEFVGDGSSFSGMYNSVKKSSNGVFGLGNVTITEERKNEIQFSDPFITNFAILITPSSVPTLNRYEDISKTFAGLTAYTAKGTLNEKRLQDLKSAHYADMKMVYASSSPETLEKVLADPKSFTYLDLAFYLDAVKSRKRIKRHPVGDQASEQFGFIMPLNSDWKPVVDEFFNANGGYTNSTAYRKILSNHLGDTGVKLLQAAK
ncbi:MAG: substrate-binding periplasmic protein [Candidatus Cyclobacteriaceae bacterium M2_1C_046]